MSTPPRSGADHPDHAGSAMGTRSVLRGLLILVLFPVLLAFGLPQAEFVQAFYAGDRSQWKAFWGVALAIEWITLLAVLATFMSVRQAATTMQVPRSLRITERWLIGLAVGGALVLAIVGAGGEQSFLSRIPSGARMFIPPSELESRLLWFAMCVTAAICEEAMFRGVALRELAVRLRSMHVAAIVTSLSFAFFHGGLEQGAAFFTYRFAVSMGLSYLAWHSRSLLPAILVHFLMDASALLAIQID